MYFSITHARVPRALYFSKEASKPGVPCDTGGRSTSLLTTQDTVPVPNIIGLDAQLRHLAERFHSTEINFIGNLVGTYNDLAELMTLTAQGKMTLHTAIYPLDAATDAILDLDSGKLRGRGILVP